MARKEARDGRHRDPGRADRSAARGVSGAGAVDRPGRVDQSAAQAADRAGGRRRVGAASRLPAGWRAARGSAEPAQRAVGEDVADGRWAELPRDRDASFEPRIVPKHTRSFDGFDEQILALYAGGMTTRE